MPEAALRVFSLKVMSPERTVFAGQARSLVAPGREGYFGVLAHHAAMVAELGIGKLAIAGDDGRRMLYAIAGGFLEVSDNHVTILVDAGERADEIDMARAEASEHRAEGRLKEQRSKAREKDVDTARATAALHRALNRLRVAREGRSSAPRE